MKIYTKKGDKGQTSLCSGEKVSKNCDRLQAYGSIDEASSSIGFALLMVKKHKTKKVLQDLQKDLFVLGSYVASPTLKSQKGLPKFPESKIEKLEKVIDKIQEKLPPLKNFILPGGTQGACALHMARTVVRRAERDCAALAEKEKMFEHTLPYLNRLSDLLFVMARQANKGRDTLA